MTGSLTKDPLFTREKACEMILNDAFGVVLNANDFFGYACADAVQVDFLEHGEKLIDMVRRFGGDGSSAFMAWHERAEPIPPHRTDGYREAREYLPGVRPNDD